MKIVKKILLTILVLYFIIMILFITLLFLVKQTVLSKEYMINKLDDFKIYEEAEKLTNNIINQAVTPNGEHIKILEKFNTKEHIKSLVDSGVASLYENESFVPNCENLQKLIEDDVEKLIENEEVKPSEEEKSIITKFEGKLVIEYDNQLKNIAKEIGTENNIPKFIKKVNTIFYAIVISTVASIILVIVIDKTNLIENIIIITGGTIVTGGGLMKLKSVIKGMDFNLISNNQGIVNVMQTVANDLVSKLDKFSKYYIIGGMAVILIVIFLRFLIKNKKKVKN